MRRWWRPGHPVRPHAIPAWETNEREETALSDKSNLWNDAGADDLGEIPHFKALAAAANSMIGNTGMHNEAVGTIFGDMLEYFTHLLDATGDDYFRMRSRAVTLYRIGGGTGTAVALLEPAARHEATNVRPMQLSEGQPNQTYCGTCRHTLYLGDGEPVHDDEDSTCKDIRVGGVFGRAEACGAKRIPGRSLSDWSELSFPDGGIIYGSTADDNAHDNSVRAGWGVEALLAYAEDRRVGPYSDRSTTEGRVDSNIGGDEVMSMLLADIYRLHDESGIDSVERDKWVRSNHDDDLLGMF